MCFCDEERNRVLEACLVTVSGDGVTCFRIDIPLLLFSLLDHTDDSDPECAMFLLFLFLMSRLGHVLRYVLTSENVRSEQRGRSPFAFLPLLSRNVQIE